MIDRTLTTYTFLSALKESGINQLDLYVPLVCKSIVTHKASEVDRDLLKKWFYEDYGIKDIYHGVLENLIRKMKGKCLSLVEGRYQVNLQEVLKVANKHPERDLSADFQNLLISVQNYAKLILNIDLPIDDVHKGLVEFFHARDGQLIFEQEKTLQILSKQKNGVKGTTKIKYIISKFVIWSKDNQPLSFNLLVKLSIGHALSSIVTMKDVQCYIGKLKDVTVALDAPIIFNLLNLNYQTNFDLERELFSVLKKQGVRFVLFQEHYQEVKQALSSTIHLLKTKDYNLDKSSRLLRYAVRNKVSSFVLQTKSQQVDKVLQDNNIIVETAPNSQNGYKEIDVRKLQDLLEFRYSDGHPENLEENRKKSIETDADVISYIYRLRGKDVASNLRNCKALLVTTNAAVAYASKHPDLSEVNHIIPACLTDVFLSTALWFNYPEVKSDVNEKVLISECYKNTTLTDDILQRFYADVKRINDEYPLSEEQILEANTSELVMEMLETKTFNDESLYTDQTAAEILEECERKRNQELKEKTDSINRIGQNVRIISKKIATISCTTIWIIMVGLFLFLRLIDYNNLGICPYICTALSVIPALWGLLCWKGIIPSQANFISCLSIKIYNLLYKKLNDKCN